MPSSRAPATTRAGCSPTCASTTTPSRSPSSVGCSREWELYFGKPEDVRPLEGELADEVRSRLAAAGFADSDLATALGDWAGNANYEARLSPDGIDRRVLEALRAATA